MPISKSALIMTLSSTHVLERLQLVQMAVTRKYDQLSFAVYDYLLICQCLFSLYKVIGRQQLKFTCRIKRSCSFKIKEQTELETMYTVFPFS